MTHTLAKALKKAGTPITTVQSMAFSIASRFFFFIKIFFLFFCLLVLSGLFYGISVHVFVYFHFHFLFLLYFIYIYSLKKSGADV